MYINNSKYNIILNKYTNIFVLTEMPYENSSIIIVLDCGTRNIFPLSNKSYILNYSSPCTFNDIKSLYKYYYVYKVDYLNYFEDYDFNYGKFIKEVYFYYKLKNI